MMIDKSTLKKIEDYAKKIHKNFDEWHNWSHINRTIKLAKYLAKKENADLDIVVVSAMLHDIGQSVGLKKHNETSAKMADKLLKKLKLDNKFIEEVKHCIICHSTSRVGEARDIEAKVVYDADIIQCLGPFGVLRFITSDMIIMRKESFKKTYQLARDFEFKVFNNTLQTKTAKKLIEKDYNYMQEFYKIHDKWDKLDFIE